MLKHCNRFHLRILKNRRKTHNNAKTRINNSLKIRKLKRRKITILGKNIEKELFLLMWENSRKMWKKNLNRIENSRIIK